MRELIIILLVFAFQLNLSFSQKLDAKIDFDSYSAFLLGEKCLTLSTNELFLEQKSKLDSLITFLKWGGYNEMHFRSNPISMYNNSKELEIIKNCMGQLKDMRKILLETSHIFKIDLIDYYSKSLNLKISKTVFYNLPVLYSKYEYKEILGKYTNSKKLDNIGKDTNQKLEKLIARYAKEREKLRRDK